MIIKSIINEDDYRQALKGLELIFDAKNGSEESNELETLSILIEQYEDEHFPIN